MISARSRVQPLRIHLSVLLFRCSRSCQKGIYSERKLKAAQYPSLYPEEAGRADVHLACCLLLPPRFRNNIFQHDEQWAQKWRKPKSHHSVQYPAQRQRHGYKSTSLYITQPSEAWVKREGEYIRVYIVVLSTSLSHIHTRARTCTHTHTHNHVTHVKC